MQDSGETGSSPCQVDGSTTSEDRAVTFNVLGNDAAGLKLVSIGHETVALNKAFNTKAGVVSFKADGTVVYKTMTN